MKILLTGGAGYIGWSLVHQLVNAKTEIEEIIVYDSLVRKNFSFFFGESIQGIPIRFIKGDILDDRKLQQALRGVDVLIHLAAKVTTPFADSDSHAFDQVNHWGTAQVANAVENSGVTHLIYLSSASVYGSTHDTVDEEYDPAPNTFYGISKLDGELHVSRLSDKLKVHIIRSGNVYGYNPVLRMDSVINAFMFEANYNGRISIVGNGAQRRSFIHVDKLCQTLTQLLETNIKAGTYNISEFNLSINEIVALVGELYPEMETIFMNQNMKGRNISIKTPCMLVENLPFTAKSIEDELKEFKAQFAF